MHFRKLDMETWERAPIYRHFIDDLRCVMSLTVEIDVTDFLRTLQGRDCRFYPSMIWVVSAAVNCREELRMGRDGNGEPGIWDAVSPYYAHFHQTDRRFSKLVTPYDPDFRTFYRRYLEDRSRLESCRGFDQQDIPPNIFDVSCLPWVHYKSFDMHIFDSGTWLAPVVTWGRYAENRDGRMTLPLSLNLHHAAGDGYHLCRFFSDVEDWMKQID